MQEHQYGCCGVAGFPEKQSMTVDDGVAMMNNRHKIPPDAMFWDIRPSMHPQGWRAIVCIG